jgi:peptidoglycan/xylan/chitin deacetylase (PgdA/CDA1 family)
MTRFPTLTLALAVICSVLSSGPSSAPGHDGRDAHDGQEDGFQRVEGGIVRGRRDARRLALAFTGHEFAEGGEAILDALAARHARASFFLTGVFLRNEAFAPLVRRMVRDGHYVGPHSDAHLLYCPWTGPKVSLVTRAQFDADLDTNLRALAAFGIAPARDTAGASAGFWIPPYEWHNPEQAEWSRARGLTLLNFTPGTRSNADYTEESSDRFVSSDAILRSILDYEQRDSDGLNGFILLLHLGAGPGRQDKMHAKLGALLDALTARGYEFARVDDLLKPTQTQTQTQTQVEPRPQASSASPASGASAAVEPSYVRVSQVGFKPGDIKTAVAFANQRLPEMFTVRDAATGRAAFNGRTRSLEGQRWGQFERHAALDFSALVAPGRYVIELGGARSRPFRIAVGAYAAVPDALLEYLRQQRCGYNPWLNAVCHVTDGRTAYGPMPAGSDIDARGGWHDAGDLLKYLLTSSNATAQLLLAYRLAPAAFGDTVDDLGHADRPNGEPDVLDEARWGLEWMLRLHPAPDQLFHQVADDRDHAGFRLPKDERVDYGWGPGGPRVVYFADGKPQGLKAYQSDSTGVANLAGRYAAAMALAYQIWKDDRSPSRRAFAQRCLKAGEEVYALGRAKEGVQQGNSYGAPYRYAEATWADDMEWGAAELFRATHTHAYLDDAIRYARLSGSTSWMGRQETGHYEFYPFMNAGHFRLHDLAPPAVRHELAAFYKDGLSKAAAQGDGNPYRIGVPFIWCSNNLTVALVTQGLFYERMSGDASYRAFITAQRDWLTGRNPWGVSMFTGIPRDGLFPRDVHLMTTKLTGREVRGGLVDGPVYERVFKSLRGVSIREPDPFAPFQDARAVYHDDIQDYSTNEPTMDGTASAVLMWALLQGDSAPR